MKTVETVAWLVGALVVAAGAVMVLMPALTSKDRADVSRAGFGDRWPFTVEEGRVSCVDGDELVFSVGGIDYALNGVADGVAARRGYETDLDPIWLSAPEGFGLRVNIGPIQEAARAQCE